MSLSLVLDDTMIATANLRELIGIEHFGALVFQRRSRAQALADVAGSAGASFIHLKTPADRDAFIARLRGEEDSKLFVHAPAHLVPGCTDENLVTFLRQVAFSPSNLHVPLDGSRVGHGWLLVRPNLLREFLIKTRENATADFFDTYGNGLVEVRNRIRLLDISDERTLLNYLSGQLDSRHFNSLTNDDYTVSKRSTDRSKLRREFDFYRLVPPQVQMFLVQPFEFQDDGVTASYRMERLAVPDMALQWVQGAFQEQEFERFLRHIFYFIAARPSKPADPGSVGRVQEALYVSKVKERIVALKALPGYAALAPLIERVCGGIDTLLQRYLELFERMRRRLPKDHLVIGHGDPCFSNILYSKGSQYLKLIDPRGAANADELYTDPYYDLAKLSHSIQGEYDFINQGTFDVSIDEELRPRLVIESPMRPWAGDLFNTHLARAGFDPVLTRLCESSLFISMLPLHIDRPRKVLGFVIRATTLVDQLSLGRTA